MRRNSRSLVGRLTEAYVSLLLTTEGTDGSRTVLLARYGPYEVRLVEFPDSSAAEPCSLWLRLYHRDFRSSLAVGHCADLDQAEALAEQLVSKARQLNRTHA